MLHNFGRYQEKDCARVGARAQSFLLLADCSRHGLLPQPGAFFFNDFFIQFFKERRGRVEFLAGFQFAWLPLVGRDSIFPYAAIP